MPSPRLQYEFRGGHGGRVVSVRRTDESYEGAVSPPRRLFVGAAEKRRKRDEDLMTIRSEFWLASPICHPPPVPARGTANSYEETHATPQEGRSPPRAPDLANVLVSNRPRNRVFY